MKIKWIVLLSAFGMMAAAQAALVEDFESYTTGSTISNDTGGVWTDIKGNGNPTIATDGSNQFLKNWGGLAEGAYRALDQTYSSGLVTAEFDIWTDTLVNDCTFGLANGGSNANWNDFGAYIGVLGTSFKARNLNSNTTVASITNGVVYSVKIVANVDTATYDVFLDNALVADDFAFRSGGATTFDALKMLSNRSTATIADGVYVDNISVIPEPATMGLFAFFGAGLLAVRRRMKM